MALPINFLGNAVNFLRSIGFQKQYDKFIAEQVQPANLYGQETAESLGPVGNTTGMAQASYDRATGLAGDFSNQYRQDVNNRFNLLGSEAQANLRARGLTGSGIVPSTMLGIENARSAELRRANDDRLNTLLGVEETFGGQNIATNQAAADARFEALRQRYLVAPQAPTPFFSSGRNF